MSVAIVKRGAFACRACFPN